MTLIINICKQQFTSLRIYDISDGQVVVPRENLRVSIHLLDLLIHCKLLFCCRISLHESKHSFNLNRVRRLWLHNWFRLWLWLLRGLRCCWWVCWYYTISFLFFCKNTDSGSFDWSNFSLNLYWTSSLLLDRFYGWSFNLNCNRKYNSCLCIIDLLLRCFELNWFRWISERNNEQAIGINTRHILLFCKGILLRFREWE